MIGILTFHRAANYGAVLQAYALQEICNTYLIENEIVDYRCGYIEKQYDYLPRVSPRHVRQFMKGIYDIPRKKKIRRQFDDFILRNLKTSKPVRRNELSEMYQKYKVLISGSDQVWNLPISGGDTTYLLDFANRNVKKISYAASIGSNEIKDEDRKVLEIYLKKYQYISVREPSAKRIVDTFFEKEAVVDVDPTILLDIEKWNQLAEKSKIKAEKFIFVYIMQPSELLYDIALWLSKQEKLSIYTLSMVQNKRKMGKDVRGMGVYDFLWMIKNAEYIVTNSFHGILFSLRFHKKFYWAFQEGKHMSNSRFEMLIEQYGIECRCCQDIERISGVPDISYEKIEKIMEQQRNLSIHRLMKNIEDVE